MLPYELRALQTQGYRVFTGRPWDLTLIGVRTSNRQQSASPSDDYFLMLYQDPTGAWIREQYQGTTDPTALYLRDPINPLGTAIVCEGQYPGLWQAGLHRGRPALVQVGTVKVYRDANRDTVLDLDPSTSQAGHYAINFHSGQGAAASAGCQCPVSQEHVDRVRDLLALQAAHGYGSKLTYTLVREESIYN